MVVAVNTRVTTLVAVKPGCSACVGSEVVGDKVIWDCVVGLAILVAVAEPTVGEMVVRGVVVAV